MPANRFNGYTDYGVGIGLRVPHYDHILSKKPIVDWFEIISENYMIDGGRPLKILDRILDQYRVVQHGVSMYFGSAQALNRDHLKRIKELTKRTNTPWLSDHLCWGSVDGRYTHDLLPLPYTFEAIRTTAERVRMVQDYLEIPVAVENVSSYAEYHDSEMTEWEFLNEVVEAADCGILLDVNNIYVSSRNHDFDPMVYVNSIPAERVAQIHIAGHSKFEKYLLDTHDHPVLDPVWKLYARAIERCGPTATLLEWDDNIPSFEEVHAEALKANRFLLAAESAIPAKELVAGEVHMNLLDLQRRMAEDVRRPLTTDYEMQKTTEDGQSTADVAASYIAPHARLSSFERLQIYNRQYWFRLISAVSEDFPTLNALLGPKRFDSLILAYLEENPSTSWTLRDLGAKLPAFLDRRPDLTGRRHHLAVDVARLEWAYVEAFDGKQLDPLAAEDVHAVGPDTQLFLQPHLQLLSLRYPVDNLVLAIKRKTAATDIVSGAASQRASHARVKIPPMRREPVYLAVHRFEDSVYYRRLEPGTFLLLSALRSGASVGDAVSQALDKAKLEAQEQTVLLRKSFAHASQLGWLCSRPVQDEDSSIFVM